MVGARYFFSQGKRIDRRFVLRYLVRAFREIEVKDLDVSNPTRLRGEIFITPMALICLLTNFGMFFLIMKSSL